MSMFDLKGGSDGNNWNYSDNTKQNYMEMIEGTVVEISNPQARDFATGAPATWPDGNPKRNLRMCIRGRSGQELAWTFAPKSAATSACLAALDPQGTRETVSIEELLGKFIRVQTQAGSYNSKNPRPWWVTILGDGEVNAVRGLKDLSQPQPAQMVGMPAPQQAPVQQTPPPPVQQPAPQPVQQQQVNPIIQASMNQAAQALGFQPNAQTNAAPVNQVSYEQDPTGGYYDQDIPF